MQPEILLAHLRALDERAPDLSAYSPSSREHQVWLAQANALILRWDRVEATSFKLAWRRLSSRPPGPLFNTVTDSAVGEILGALNRAMADLELEVPTERAISFGTGAVYDFFRALNRVIESAEKSIFIIDPYLDRTVFENYLVSRPNNVSGRLLLNRNAETVLPAASKYNDQHGGVVELRKSKKIHDRVVFIDGYVCWVIGQSIKDAAKAKPTYLVPLPPDVVQDKLSSYEEIWLSAEKLEIGC